MAEGLVYLSAEGLLLGSLCSSLVYCVVESLHAVLGIGKPLGLVGGIQVCSSWCGSFGMKL